MPEAYTEVKLKVPRRTADAVCCFITDNISSGLVLEEEDDAPTTDITFYVAGSDPLPYRQALTEYLGQVLPRGASEMPDIRERVIKNVEWVEEYKRSIKPLEIDRGIVVRPSWAAAVESAEYEIIIEPKMAFGTGSHETTRSCLKAIRRRFRDGMRFLDLGCGSGILSVLASKMGAGYILAVDHDVAAVENCIENFAVNSVSTAHEIMFGSIEICNQRAPFDFVCVNIIKSFILPRLDRLLALVFKGGVLVLSGLLTGDEKEISERLRELSQDDFTIMRDNQWLTYVVQKR